MYDDFEKRFDYTLKGDFKRWFEHLADTDVWAWCRAQEEAVEHRVYLTGLRAWLLGFFCGGGFMYLVFFVVGIARR